MKNIRNKAAGILVQLANRYQLHTNLYRTEFSFNSVIYLVTITANASTATNEKKTSNETGIKSNSLSLKINYCVHFRFKIYCQFKVVDHRPVSLTTFVCFSIFKCHCIVYLYVFEMNQKETETERGRVFV